MPSRLDEAAEAVCGALHRLGWKFHGEVRESDGNLATYWRRGEVPHAVSIVVRRHDPWVVASVRWHNLSAPPRIIRTDLDLKIDCGAERTRTDIEFQAEGVVERCLTIFSDVTSGTGHAGPEYLVQKHGAWRPSI